MDGLPRQEQVSGILMVLSSRFWKVAMMFLPRFLSLSLFSHIAYPRATMKFADDRSAAAKTAVHQTGYHYQNNFPNPNANIPSPQKYHLNLLGLLKPNPLTLPLPPL